MPILKSIKQSDAILLDSHVSLWLFEDLPQLDQKISDLIEDCRTYGKLYISAISFWELGTLVRKGRIRLKIDYRDWVKTVSRQLGVNIAGVDLSIIMNGLEIDGLGQHSDPIDRLIVASALERDAILLTRDEALIEGAKKGQYKVFEV